MLLKSQLEGLSCIQEGLLAGGLADGRILVWKADSLLKGAGAHEAVDITGTGTKAGLAPRVGGAVSSNLPPMRQNDWRCLNALKCA